MASPAAHDRDVERAAAPAGPEALDSRRADNRRRMLIAGAINAALVAAEVVGGILTGSLALLADEGHVRSDLGAIVLAVLAAALAARSGGPRRTFGYQRSEVVAAVLVSGTVILATGWRPIDPLASLAIAALILGSSIRLVREPLDVLMEAAPPGVDVDAIARSVASVGGVTQVHELHVWSVTPGFETLAAHVVVARGEDRDRARREVEFLLKDRYGIAHTTLQMEEEADEDALLQVETEPRRS